jgi:hypothetical protein
MGQTFCSRINSATRSSTCFSIPTVQERSTNAVKTCNISYVMRAFHAALWNLQYISECMYSLGENPIIRSRALVKLIDRMGSDL